VTKLSWKSVLSLVLALPLSTGVFLQRGCSDTGGVVHYSNRYEAAQHKTVLIATSYGQGSGVVVIRKNDLGQKRVFVWTACHVVEGVSTAKVIINIRNETRRVGQTIFNGRVIGFSKEIDCALLWVDAPADYFVGAEFDSSVPLRVGDTLYHCGNFLGVSFDGSISMGVVSQLGIFPPDMKGWPWPVADQMTVSIVPGSSGGPVFNRKNDKVVGLAVGSFPGTDLYIYVPVRALQQVGRVNGTRFAIRGNWCPSDEVLTKSVKGVPQDVAEIEPDEHSIPGCTD
jgi:S1-C subfamily serine protease